VQEIKRDSSEWINQEKSARGNSSWQEGYGAFSDSKSQITQIAAYIETQETHHKKRGFRDEYLQLLKQFGVEYDERYVLKDIAE